MVHGVQGIAKALGESGCYFLSLCKVAENNGSRFVDVILEAAEAISAGTMSPECYVNDAGRLYSALVRQSWDVVKAGPGHPLPLEYCPAPGEREILRFERPAPDGGEPLAHFVVGDGRGGVAWDPWPGSLTVAQGRLVSKRILRRKP